MTNTTPSYSRSISVAPFCGGLIIAIALAMIMPGNSNEVVFSGIVNLVIYFFVCLLIAWVYRKLKWPAKSEFVLVLGFPLAVLACSLIKLVTDIASVMPR